MKIERKSLSGRTYYTVLVDAGELVVASGKTLPYSAWIGTISATGEINLWHPAGYRPRGYDAAAMQLLKKARKRILAEPTADAPDEADVLCALAKS